MGFADSGKNLSKKIEEILIPYFYLLVQMIILFIVEICTSKNIFAIMKFNFFLGGLIVGVVMFLFSFGSIFLTILGIKNVWRRWGFFGRLGYILIHLMFIISQLFYFISWIIYCIKY